MFILYSMQDQISFDRLIIAGDFNYSNLRPHLLTRATSKECVISGAKDEGYNLKYNNKRIDSKWNQLS
jgi:hypothetical protein